MRKILRVLNCAEAAARRRGFRKPRWVDYSDIMRHKVYKTSRNSWQLALDSLRLPVDGLRLEELAETTGSANCNRCQMTVLTVTVIGWQYCVHLYEDT